MKVHDRKSIQGKEDSKCKGTEARDYLVSFEKENKSGRQCSRQD